MKKNVLLFVLFAIAVAELSPVWKRVSPYGIYKSAQLSIASKHVFAGTSDVEEKTHPDEAELLNFSSSDPEWVSIGPNQQVTASRNSDKVASLSHRFGGNNSNITIRVWTISKIIANEPKPDLEVFFDNAFPAETALKLSRDGKRLGILYNKADNTSHLIVYDTIQDKIISSYTGKGYGRHLTMSSDEEERFFAFHVAGAITVYDSKLKQVRWNGNVKFSDYALDISADGHTLVYGFETLEIAQWNGQQYQIVHNTTLRGHFVANLIAQQDKLVIGWTTFDSLQTTIQAYHLGKDGNIKLLFTTSYGTSEILQDIPYDLAITDDAQFFVVGSWGNQTDNNPQVRLFATEGDGTPLASLHTPGSVFTVDVATDTSNPRLLHLVAGCKMVHANQRGRGGVLYYLRHERK